MEFEKWIGRYVTVIRVQDERTYSAKFEAWDAEKERVILGPKLIYIPAEEILKIIPSEPGPLRRGPAAGISARAHSVGYVMSNNLQFENAIHFRSSVMVWKGDRLIKLRAVIVAHNEEEVMLRTGDKLSKQDYRFVVRSIRGN